MRVGSGLDVHAFGAGDGRLVLAGEKIPDADGLAGHTDADVVAHAVTDALLGAAGAGDMGTWFGVGEPGLAGADSLGLLREVVEALGARGFAVGNVDCTVVAQRPRLADHRRAMVDNLAAALDTQAVSVKLTSTDELGSVGRGEGIACWAVCLLSGPGPAGSRPG